MTTGKKSLNSFGYYFSAKCVSILLALFVFVVGFTVGSIGFAASASGTNTTMGIKIDSNLNTFTDSVSIAGTKNLKSGKITRNADGSRMQSYTGEIMTGSDIKLRYILKPVSLTEVNKQRLTQYSKAGLKGDLAPFARRSSRVTMRLVAKAGGKVIKNEKKEYKNQTDLTFDTYWVPKNATEVNFRIFIIDCLYDSAEQSYPMTKTITVSLQTGKQSTTKKSENKRGATGSSRETVTQKLANRDVNASMLVNLQNVDLNAYSHYNQEYQLIGEQGKYTILGKSAPNKTITIQLSPVTILHGGTSYISFTTHKLEPGFPETGERKYKKQTQNQTASFTVPPDVEMVTVDVYMTFSAGDPKHPDWDDGVLRRYYIIFTSDDAFKKAYQLYTGKSLKDFVPKDTQEETEETEETGESEIQKKDEEPVGKDKDAEKEDEDSGGIGIGAIGGGIALAGAAAFGASQLLNGGGNGGAAASGGGESEVADAPAPEPETFVYKDPAGFESMYIRDPSDGQWYNYQDYQDGYRAPVDMDKLQEYDAQRQQDVEWNDEQMQKLEKRETDFDKELKQDYQDMLDREQKIRQDTYKDMMALKTNTYSMSEAERKTFLENRQTDLEQSAKKAERVADAWNVATKTAEVVQKVADMGVDTLAVATAPVGGQLVADVYTSTKNIGGNVMDAAVNNKSIVDAAIKGAAQAGADIVQGHAGGKWAQKLATYAASEALKEGIVAAVDGENAVKAALKGGLQGACKWGIESAGDVMKGDFRQRAKNTLTQRNKEIQNMWGKSDISKKSLNELEALQYRRFFQREKAILAKQGLGQTIAKETTSAIGDMSIKGKSFSEAEFGEKW